MTGRLLFRGLLIFSFKLSNLYIFQNIFIHRKVESVNSELNPLLVERFLLQIQGSVKILQKFKNVMLKIAILPVKITAFQHLQ